MTTLADELRQGADKLRTLASLAAADSGNTHWKATRHFPNQPDSTFTSLWATGIKPLLGGGGRVAPYVTAPVGEYIAAMDPTLGLLLADWLDSAAQDAEQIGPDHHALAVARQINSTP